MRPRVFMFMPHRLDVSGAASFGEIVYLFRHGESRPNFWDRELIEVAMDRLWEYQYDPATDLIMVAGHMAPLIKFCVAVADEYPTARALFWDSIDARYVAQPLLMKDTEDDEPDAGVAVQSDEDRSRAVRPSRRRTA